MNKFLFVVLALCVAASAEAKSPEQKCQPFKKLGARAAELRDAGVPRSRLIAQIENRSDVDSNVRAVMRQAVNGVYFFSSLRAPEAGAKAHALCVSKVKAGELCWSICKSGKRCPTSPIVSGSNCGG
jgi:hypothetical protein